MRKAILFFLSITSIHFCCAQTLVKITKKDGTHVETTLTSFTGREATTSYGTFALKDLSEINFDGHNPADKKFYEILEDNYVSARFDYKPASTSIQPDSPLIDELPSEDGKLSFSEVVTLDSASKEDLYLRARTYFIDHFKSGKDVIQMDEKSEGIIIGKAWNDIYVAVLMTTAKIQMWYSIKIQVKDGRYKYFIYDIQFTSYPSQYAASSTSPADGMFYKTVYYKQNGKPRDVNSKYKESMLASIENLRSNIKQAMALKSSKKKDDWE